MPNGVDRRWVMSYQSDENRGTVSSQLIDRATRDPQFRQDLLQNPTETVERELGVRVPASTEIRVVEETPSTLYLVLPPATVAPGQELSDRELEQVAGGWSATTETCAASRPC
jgi:hypothetical protein